MLKDPKIIRPYTRSQGCSAKPSQYLRSDFDCSSVRSPWWSDKPCAAIGTSCFTSTRSHFLPTVEAVHRCMDHKLGQLRSPRCSHPDGGRLEGPCFATAAIALFAVAALRLSPLLPRARHDDWRHCASDLFRVRYVVGRWTSGEGARIISLCSEVTSGRAKHPKHLRHTDASAPKHKCHWFSLGSLAS